MMWDSGENTIRSSEGVEVNNFWMVETFDRQGLLGKPYQQVQMPLQASV